MTIWTALVFVGLGVLLRMAFERPNRFADVDELVAQNRDRARGNERGDA